MEHSWLIFDVAALNLCHQVAEFCQKQNDKPVEQKQRKMCKRYRTIIAALMYHIKIKSKRLKPVVLGESDYSDNSSVILT